MIRHNAVMGVAHWVLSLLIVVVTLALYVPISPLFPSADIDGGWAFALNVAVDRGLVFGRDIVFTFGPYGAAYTTLYHPTIDTMMLLSTALLGAAFASGMLCLTAGWTERIGALLLLALMGVLARDALFFALPLTLLLLVCRVAVRDKTAGVGRGITPSLRVRCSLLLLVMALSLLFLVKGTFAVASGMVLALSFGVLLLQGRWTMAFGGASLFVVSVPAFWVLVGQPLAALPGFFISQGPIVSGYTEAMSTPGGPFLSAQFIAGFLILAALHFRPANLVGVALAVGVTGLTFVAFKGGFVRADTHMAMAAGFIAILASVLAFGRGRIRGAIGVAVGLIVWAVIDVTVMGASLAALPARIVTPFVSASTMLAVRITAPSTLKHLYADSLAVIAFRNPLPPLSGSTDVYSYGQSILLARGMDWAPRPTLQSYLAYTPSLAAADAAFLASPKAPRNVVFSVEPIDGRLAALEDGPSWPELLSRYEFADLHGNMAIMRRRQIKAPQPIADGPVTEGNFRINDIIALPAGDQPLWARIEVSPTLVGKLVSGMFRLPPLSITYRFADGHNQVFRFISGMGAAGFLASPVVTSTADFVSLALPNSDEYLAAKRPQSLIISAEQGAGLLWNPLIKVKFFQAVFPSQPDVRRWLFDQVETEAARQRKLPTTADCAVDLIDLRRPQDFPVRVGKFLQVDGWAAVSVKNSLAPDSTSVTLTAPDGEITAIRAKRIARDDVNTYFKKPDMGLIGYTALADLTGLGGDYMLGLRITKDDHSWNCTTQVPVRFGGVGK